MLFIVLIWFNLSHKIVIIYVIHRIHRILEIKFPVFCIFKTRDILCNLGSKLEHIEDSKRQALKELVYEYKHLFPDLPTRINKLFHNVDVGDAKPIEQRPYRSIPVKQLILEVEIQYLLETDFIEPSESEWLSLCILVPKPDGGFRMCTDYCIKADTFPMPRIYDCIYKIGQSKFVSKFDLLKGFLHISLTEKAKKILAFVTPDGLL